ncbi:MAG TPA: carboxypeptidase M32 [Polyangiaceae bacterium LLY-WYZ-14_1]|nr:carboxypeptidase M32 [Polyangiaceae bacterium LLY-WYZ-14_1]
MPSLSSPAGAPTPALAALRGHLETLHDLQASAYLLEWDQMTHMPPGGAPARGRALATLGRLEHELIVSDTLGEALDEAARAVDGRPEDDVDVGMVRWTRRRRARALRLPAAFVTELRTHLAAAYEAWTRARPANDFAAVRPHLERTVELSRRYAEFFPDAEHPADPHIDEHDPGLDAAQVGALFDTLRPGLRELLGEVRRRPDPDASFLRGKFDPEVQLSFGKEVVTALGYDWDRGTQDLTHHPFMVRFSIGDVRITTRVDPHDLGDALFSTIHEAGHALYEQGIHPSLEGTPLAGGAASWIHESQSRLWENHVARSPAFWRHFYPLLQARFPDAFRHIAEDDFVAAVNRVAPSLIRVDADQLTYDFHVMIRVELERALLEGTLPVSELPDAWDAAYERDLGVRAETVARGCLQDVHWFVAPIGGTFQGYTFGNVLSAQVYEAALAAHPEIPEQAAEGCFDTLRSFLTERLYRWGSVLEPPALVERATGRPLEAAPYLRLLRAKFLP